MQTRTHNINDHKSKFVSLLSLHVFIIQKVYLQGFSATRDFLCTGQFSDSQRGRSEPESKESDSLVLKTAGHGFMQEK